MSNQPIEEKCNWREEFDEKFGVFSTNVNKRPLTSKAIESFIENLIEQERKIMAGVIEMSKQGWIDEGRIEERKRMSDSVGFMRQWLNEDRITDGKKMVSNDDLLYWLNINK